MSGHNKRSGPYAACARKFGEKLRARYDRTVNAWSGPYNGNRVFDVKRRANVGQSCHLRVRIVVIVVFVTVIRTRPFDYAAENVECARLQPTSRRAFRLSRRRNNDLPTGTRYQRPRSPRLPRPLYRLPVPLGHYRRPLSEKSYAYVRRRLPPRGGVSTMSG